MFNFFNSKENRIYYCKHIAPGVCAYQDETIFIGEETLKNMDKSFAGKPIFINHQTVDPATEKQQAVGYVVESFYLPEDGTHWAKMLIIEDSAHEVIQNGWKVSNAYQPTQFGVGGEWHNVPYNREVTDAYYTHLALVENPRYEEAEIMTPEQFKQYKEAKKSQLEQLQNSKPEEKSKQGDKKMNFKLWKKQEVTNSDDISNVMVELSNGSTVSIGEMVNSVEKDLKEKEDKKNKCNEDDIMEKVVKVNGEDMKVCDLVAAFEKKDKKNEDEEDKDKAKDEEKKDKKNESDEDKKDEEKKDKKNESDEDKKDEEKKDKKNEDDEDKKKDEEKKDKKNSKDLLNAEEKANAQEFVGVVADTMARKLARGAERYGSAK